MKTEYLKKSNSCSVDGCLRDKRISGLCGMHHQRLLRNGDTGGNSPLKQFDGKTKHYLYATWMNMKQRCYNEKNTKYPIYGARGINVCDRWLNSFWDFVNDLGERPDGCTLDRVNPDLGYSPENCRWATIYEQNNNVRPRKAKILGISVKGISWSDRYKSYDVRYRGKYFGRYKDYFDAICARKSAENKFC